MDSCARLADVQSREIDPFGWDGHTWSKSRRSETADSRSVRVATMNILTDTFPYVIELAIASKVRFKQLLVEIERLDASILGLNEVSRTSLELILASGFVRRNYYVSELPSNDNGTLDAPHGCVLLSKFPLQHCFAVDAWPNGGKTCRKSIVGVVDVAGKSFAFCSLHTLAHQKTSTMAIRKTQIRNMVEYLKGLGSDSFFIMGDLNLHELSEDACITENNLLDVWAETHFGSEGDQDPGNTFDPEINNMISRYIPGENRKMRLDRILCSKGNSLVPSSPCSLWGHEAVDAARDIFLSDHFGLFVDLECSSVGFQGQPDVQAIIMTNGRKEFREHSLSPLKFARALIVHFIWLLLRFFGLK